MVFATLGFCPIGFLPISELTHRVEFLPHWVFAALGFYCVGFLPRWVFATLSFCRICFLPRWVLITYPGPVAVEDTNGQPLHLIGEVTFKITIEGHDGLLDFCPVGFLPISELTH